ASGKDSISRAGNDAFSPAAPDSRPLALTPRHSTVISNHAGIPDFHVASRTSSMGRELDAPPNTLGFTRMISPGRPARTRAANQSDPHRWRGPWSFHAAKPKSRAPQSGQSSIRQDSSSAYWTTKTSDLAIAPSRDDPVVIFSSSFNVERNIPAEISIFRGPLFSVAYAARVGPDQHTSERVRSGGRFSPADRPREGGKALTVRMGL